MNESEIEQVASYWLTEAKEALEVAGHLLEKGDYSYALFFGHLAVEKSLKALFVMKRGEHAPYTHNLLKLAEVAGLEVDDAQTEALITVTGFNIEARYPDLKRAFREKCTLEYTERHMELIEDLLRWLRSQMP